MKGNSDRITRSILAILLCALLSSNKCDHAEDNSPWGIGDVGDSFQQWTAELVQLYEKDFGRGELPHDFQPVRTRTQHQLESHFHRTGDVILEELVRLQHETDNRSVPAESLTPRNVFGRIANAISTKKIRDRFTRNKAEKEFHKQSRRMEGVLESMGAADISFPEVQRDVAKFFSHVEALTAKYGGEYLKEGSVHKAGFDLFAMTMLARLTGGRIPSERAAYALALLHPVTDTYLDSKAPGVKQAMVKISTWLEGKRVKAETPYEKLVFKLLNDMKTDFPMKQHPILWETMRRLQRAQLSSTAFQGKDIDMNAMAYNTFEKGGLTYLVFAYLACGKLSFGQGEYFFKAGALLQLVDDMLDMRADYAENHHTLWTEAYRQHGHAKDPTLRMFQIQRYLQENTGRLTNYGENSRFQKLFDTAFKLFMMSAMFDPFVFRALKGIMNHYTPTTKWGMEAIVYGMLERLSETPGDVTRFLHVMDMGFLNGRFFEGGERGGSLTVREKFIHMPAWLAMRMGNVIHKGYHRFVFPTTEAGQALSTSMMILGGAGWIYGVGSNLHAAGPEFAGLTIPAIVGAYQVARNRPNWIVSYLTLALAAAVAANYAIDDEE